MIYESFNILSLDNFKQMFQIWNLIVSEKPSVMSHGIETWLSVQQLVEGNIMSVQFSVNLFLITLVL